MQYKFHPFERAVGFFIVIAITGSLFFGIGVAIKKNWLEEKNFYYTYVSSANNIRVGTSVFMGGLKIGKIEDIDFDQTQQIKVKFSLLKKYAINVTDGSKVYFSRPFIIGDKVLNIIPSIKTQKLLASGNFLPLSDQLDVMDILTGEKINEMVTHVEHIIKNTDDLIMTSKNVMSEIHQDEQIKKIMSNVTLASEQLKHSPQIVSSVFQMLKNLNELSKELNHLRPVFTQMAHQFPKGSQKIMTLLNESVTTIKAIQKNYFIRDHIETVREEEKVMLKNNQNASSHRLPAGQGH